MLCLIIIICIINIIMQADKHTHTHTLTHWSHKKGGWLSGKELLSNVKNKISTRIGKQNNLINEITFLEDVLARGEIHF